MDVVKRNVEEMRGCIDIESVPGKGSVFKIKLPLTMAIIDGLVVRVGHERFVLPITSVKISLRPQLEQIHMIQGKAEVLQLRGKSIPIVRLHRRFNVPEAVTRIDNGILVVIESFGSTYALLVDEMVGRQEVVIKSLGALMRGIAGVSGGAILGDGTIAIIIDPSSLVAQQQTSVFLEKDQG